MAARSKKQREQLKRNDLQRRKLARQKRRTARPPMEGLRFDAPESQNEVDDDDSRNDLAAAAPHLDDADADEADSDEAEWPDETEPLDALDQHLAETDSVDAEPPGLSEQEQADIDRWWDKYDASAGPARLTMVREKLETLSVDDPRLERFFPEAIDELESSLSGEQYVAFLEDLYRVRHDVFSLDADWHVRSLVLAYLRQDRMDDVDRVVMLLANEQKKIGDPFFNLMTTIRLAGRTAAAEALIESAVQRLPESGLTSRAVGKVTDWAMFAHYQRCLAAGVTEAAIADLHAAAIKLGMQDSEEHATQRRDVLLHLSGQAKKQWVKSELITGKQTSFRKIYLLGFDYQRWLCQERQLKPIVADELRRMVILLINEIDYPFNELLRGLSRLRFDAYISRKMGFMSLDAIHAPATLIAMKHYYDFLRDLGLIKPVDCQKSHAVCDVLLTELRKAFEDEWRNYQFLEAYDIE